MPPTDNLPSPRRARLFRNGANQSLRIPRDMEFPGTEVTLTRDGDALVVRPVGRPTLLSVLATLRDLDEDFELPADAPAEPVDL